MKKENKKYNYDLYKELRTKKECLYNNYKYIVIEKNQVFRSYDFTFYDSLKFEFFGIIDTNKKDIFTMDNIKEIQDEMSREAEQKAIEEIKKNYQYYLNIQKEAFNKRIENEDFKRSLIYNYYGERFLQMFIDNVSIDDFRNQLLNNVLYKRQSLNDHKFMTMFLELSKSEIVEQFKTMILDGFYLDKWDFNYNWNNKKEFEQFPVDFSFNNYVSLSLNKIELLINEYYKIINNPSETLEKCKKLYNICNEFYNNNNNKTCYLYLGNDLKLKILDFQNLIYKLHDGKDQFFSYYLLTNNEQQKVIEYNQNVNSLQRENDILVKDIKKLEFNNKIIYMEA